jgi:prolyl oligopeptidase
MYLMISSLLPNTLSLKNIRRPTFAIRGGSNGGLLVATMTQRPELMKVALPAVMDMDVTIHLQQEQVGYDYGTTRQQRDV